MINFIEKIMRQNIRRYTVIGANKILDNHWEWMENNKDTKNYCKRDKFERFLWFK